MSQGIRHGVLAIHGFTATPECLESLVLPLRQKGFIVEAPLLAGHGTTVEELAKTTWHDWYGSVEKAYLNLKKKVDHISVVGISLGGLLTLMLASEHHEIDRIALLATPVFLTGFLAEKVLPVVANSFLKHIYPYQRKWAGPAINDPIARDQFKCYTKMPIRSIMEIVNFQKEVAPRIPHITIPTLIIHSPYDTTAPFANMAYLKDHLGSSEIKTVTLEKSDHVLTLDYEKDLVAQEVVDFFSKQ